MDYPEHISAIISATDSILIIGFALLVIAILISIPKILKAMKQRQVLEAQRFQQQMDRDNVLIAVIEKNTLAHSELKLTLENDREWQKADRKTHIKSLERIHERLDSQDRKLDSQDKKLDVLINRRDK